jgi:hypothetical protein
MIRWTFAGLIAGGLALVAAPSARAGEPASFEWSAPLSCPSRDAMLERLREGGTGATALDTRVTVEQAAEDHYRARVDLVAGHQWSERSLEASSCDAIAQAVVVIVRVAAAAAPPTAAALDPGETANAADGASAPAPPLPAPTRLAPPPASVPAVDEDRGRGFSARAAFALDAGTRYDATPGFGIGTAWRGRHLRFALDLDAFAPPPQATQEPALLPAGIALNVAVPAGIASPYETDAHAWLLTASAEGCASEPLASLAVLVDACLGLAFEHPRFDSVTALGLVPLAELAAEWWPNRVLAVRASTRWLLDVPRPAPTGALVAFQPSLGIVVLLGK